MMELVDVLQIIEKREDEATGDPNPTRRRKVIIYDYTKPWFSDNLNMEQMQCG